MTDKNRSIGVDEIAYRIVKARAAYRGELLWEAATELIKAGAGDEPEAVKEFVHALRDGGGES